MKQCVLVKVYDNTAAFDERTQKILNIATMNFVAMTSALIVGSKGEGGEGATLNPVEDCYCGIELIYQESISDELAEDFKVAVERRLITFYEMSELDMRVEVEIR